jgi:hypothetical protein
LKWLAAAQAPDHHHKARHHKPESYPRRDQEDNGKRNPHTHLKDIQHLSPPLLF